MAFSYKDYEQSDKVKQYEQALSEKEATKPADWTGGSYGAAVQEALDKVLNRDKFSYDLNGDALYQQYKDQYTRLGQTAMMDTMGQAAALTGGYGNSYATTAGQQAYQGYLQELNDIVPELYQQAYNRYTQEGQDMINQYSMLSDQYNQEYSRYRDTVSDYNTERAYLADMLNAERDYDYSQYADGRDFAFNTYTDERNYQYQQERDAVSDQQWQTTFDENVRQYNQNYAYQQQQDAIQQAQWQAEFDEAIRQYNASLAEEQRQYNETLAYNQQQYNDSKATSTSTSSKSSSGSSSGGSSYNNGGLTTAQIKEMQNYYGTSADGMWGKNSTSAAGGLDAQSAWTKYQASKGSKYNNGMTKSEVLSAADAYYSAHPNVALDSRTIDTYLSQNGYTSADGSSTLFKARLQELKSSNGGNQYTGQR